MLFFINFTLICTILRVRGMSSEHRQPLSERSAVLTLSMTSDTTAATPPGSRSDTSRTDHVSNATLSDMSTARSPMTANAVSEPSEELCYLEEAFNGESVIGCRTQNHYTSTIDTWPGMEEPFPNLSEQCLLWNSSCSGNRSLAMDTFFSDTWKLAKHSCFRIPTDENCARLYDADQLSHFQAIKDWMGTPQCLSSELEFDEKHRLATAYFDRWDSCCDSCELNAEKTDMFYWPDANADTSCLSIVGENPHPIDYGATTDPFGKIYWGCSTSDSRSGLVNITTAKLWSFGSVSTKQMLVDPWGPQPCPAGTTSFSKTSGPSITNATESAGDHSTVLHSIRSNALASNLSISTVVLDGFTL